MISNVKYVDNYNDVKFKEDVLNYYNEVYDTHTLFMPRTYIDMLYYAKYLIEKNNMDYSSILQGNIDELADLLNKGYKEFGLLNRMMIKRDFVDNKFYTLLKYIAFQDYEFPSFNDRVFDAFIEEDKKYLFISSGNVPYIKQPNVDILADKSYRSSTDSFSAIMSSYFIYDEIRGIKRNIYKSAEEVNRKEYDYIIYYNHGKYMDMAEYLHQKCIVTKNTFSIYNYNNISNISSKERKYSLLRSMKNVIIDKGNAYILQEGLYNRNLDNPINIKDLTYIDTDKIKDILLSTEEIKDVSINVLPDNMLEHNLRIGISIYTNNDDKKDILNLIDRNNTITNRINELNEKISNKIDELIVR